MKDTILKLLFNEIYNEADVTKLVQKLSSLLIVVFQAAANDEGNHTPISAKHLEAAFDSVSSIRKDKIDQDTNLSQEQKNILKNAIDADFEARLICAKETLRSHGILGE